MSVKTKTVRWLEDTLVSSGDGGKRMMIFMGRKDARTLAKSILLGLKDTASIPTVLHRGDKEKFPAILRVGSKPKPQLLLMFWDKDGFSGLKTEVLEKALKAAKRKQHKA